MSSSSAESGQSLCAVVNFRRSEGALKAVRVVKIHLRANEDLPEETEKHEDDSSIASSNYELYRNTLQGKTPGIFQHFLVKLGQVDKVVVFKQVF